MGAKFDAFATGFADGFVTQRNAREAANQKFGDDLLRNRISKWDEEKQKTKAQEAADAALIQQARGIVGNTSLPTHIRESDALALIVNDLKTYDDPKYVAERFETAISRGAFESIAADPTNMSLDNEMNNIMLSGGAATRDDSITGMNDAFRNNLNTAMSTLPEDLKGKVTVFSGYRDAGVQANIVAENMQKYGFGPSDVNEWKSDVSNLGPEAAGEKWASRFNGTGLRQYVALPGSSKHQQGKAADLMFDGTRLDQVDAETRDRIHKHMEQYGLTFRMSHEPWQVELSEDNSNTFRNSTETRTAPLAPASETETDTDEKPLFERVVDSFFGLNKDYYIKQADENFRKYLESTGELELYNQVRSGMKVLTPPSSSLRYDTTLMNGEIKEPPSLTSVNSIDDIEAIEAEIKAFGINAPAPYMSALTDLRTKFAEMDPNLLPIKELTNKGAVRAAYQYYDKLDEAGKKAVPAGYAAALNDLYSSYQDDEAGEKLTRSFIATRFFDLQQAAAKGKEDDVAAFNLFKGVTLPRMLEAIEAANPEDAKLPDLVELYTRRGELSRLDNADPNEVVKIDELISANLQAVRAQESIKEEGETKIVQVNADGTWSEINVTKRYNGTNFEYVDADGKEYDIGKNAEEGKPRYEVVTDEEWKEHTKIYNAMSKDRNTYRQYANNLVASMPLAARTYTIVENNPLVTRAASGLGKDIVGAANEVITAVNMLQSVFQDTSVDQSITKAEIADQIDFATLEQVAAGRGLETIDSPQARARAMFEANMILLTFQIGGLEGQRGNAMSNKDFERLQQVFKSTDPKVTKQLMREYFQDKINKATALERSVFDTSYEGGSAAAWEARTGINFFSQSDNISRLEKLIEGNSQAEAAYRLFTAEVESPIAAPPTQPETSTSKYVVGGTYNGRKIVAVNGDKITVVTDKGTQVTIKAK